MAVEHADVNVTLEKIGMSSKKLMSILYKVNVRIAFAVVSLIRVYLHSLL